MFIMKAFAENTSTLTEMQRRINSNVGIGGTNPQTRFYLRTGTSTLGGNRRTIGRPATIRPVRRGR